MENKPLQQRAGNNIGVSPILGSGYQQYVGAPMLTLENTDTVLWESAKGVIRAPGGSKPTFPGLLLTRDLALGDIEVDLFFVDDVGHEFFVGDGALLTGEGAAPLVLDGIAGKLGASPFGLCADAGEKIIARVTSATLPSGKVQVVPYSKDWKIKGGGKGGLSDGGARCFRGVVTLAGVDFEPRAGVTWEPLVNLGSLSGGGGFLSLILTNADPVNNAVVQVCYVGPDGLEYPINTATNALGLIDVLADAVVDVAAFTGGAEQFRTYVQHPSKLRVKFGAGNAAIGRVQALLMVGENDIAPDLFQEAS